MNQEISSGVAVSIVDYAASTNQKHRAGASVVKRGSSIHGAVSGTVV